MIWPRDDLVPLPEIPPIEISRWVWRIGKFCGPIAWPFLQLEYRCAEVRLRTFLRKVQRCEYRSQLGAVLGPPKYAISGTGMGPNIDLFEVYERKRCVVQVAFHDGRVRFIAGCVNWTRFDIATGFANHQHRGAEQLVSSQL